MRAVLNNTQIRMLFQELPVNSLVVIATPIRDVQHITPTSLRHGLAMLVISLARDRILYS